MSNSAQFRTNKKSEAFWTVTFDHVYVNGVAAQSDRDLNLTKGTGVVTRYLFDAR